MSAQHNISIGKAFGIFILMQIVFLLSYLLTTIIIPIGSELIKQTLVELSRIPITFASLWGLIYLLFRQELSTYFVKRPTLTIISKYFMLGILLPAVILLIYLVSGNMSFLFSSFEPTPVYSLYIFSTIAGALAAGVIEEIMFRGFLLKIFIDSLGKWKAVVITSLLFGVVHILFYPVKPESLGGFLLVVSSISLMGGLAALLVLKTRNIWSGVMFHIGWNLCFTGKIVKIFNYEENIEAGIVNFRVADESLWIIGGPMGIESSLIVIIVLLGVILFYLKCFQSKKGIYYGKS